MAGPLANQVCDLAYLGVTGSDRPRLLDRLGEDPALIKDARIGYRAWENDWVSGSRDDSGARNGGRRLVRLARAHVATMTAATLYVNYELHEELPGAREEDWSC
jgi:hypothetical protein